MDVIFVPFHVLQNALIVSRKYMGYVDRRTYEERGEEKAGGTPDIAAVRYCRGDYSDERG